MKLTRKVATRTAVLVATGGVVLGIAATALAASPPYEPDSGHQLGQILFYDASGNLVTSGNINDDPNFKYAVATTADPQTSNTVATLYGYTPRPVGSDPATWPGEQLSGTTSFPVAAPANIAALGAHRPVVTMDTTANGNINLAGYLADRPNDDAAGSGWENVYQLRIKTLGNTKWWATDIQVNPATGAWTMVYPTLAATTTAVTAGPASPQTETTLGAGAPNAVTLKATVTDGAAGSVQFKDTDSNTNLGSAQVLPGTSGGTNFVTTTIAAGLAVGAHHYSATFTPAAGALFNGSNGALTYQVNSKAADATSTTLSVTPLPTTVGNTFTLSSHVSDTDASGTVPVGTVTWKDGANTIAGPTAVDGSGDASAGPSAFGLAQGNHSITAVFTPTNSALFNGSSSAAVAFSLNPAAGDPCSNAPTTPGDNSTKPYPGDARTNLCSADANAQVTVPRGNLFISTPYTPANPFDLGTMRLSADGTTLHAGPVPFGTAGASPAWSDGVTIIDTRSAGEGWTAAVTSTNFTKSGGGGTINACNLGFTSVAPHYIQGNAINGTAPKVVSTVDIANGGAPGVAAGATCSTGLAGGPHNFASIPGAPANPNGGTGSVYVSGVVDLYAPTSTAAGLYTATMTFTVF